MLIPILYTFLLFLLASLLSSSSSAVLDQTSCNGDPALCSLSYAQVVFAGAHDSFAVAYGSPAANQNYLVDVQLKDGIRVLQGQGHVVNNAVELCHTQCSLLDAGPLATYLAKVRAFLDANPDQVITLIWSNQGADISLWAKAYAAAGLDAMSYVPKTTPAASANLLTIWPTLGDMVAANKRVVSFIDKGANPAVAPYLLDEFTYVFETPFDQTDQTFPCTNDRPGGSPDGKLFVMNHFLDRELFNNILVPDTPKLNETNSADPALVGSIAVQVAGCQANFNRNPNFILVDFYDQPNAQAPVLPYTAQLNGIVSSPPLGGIGNGTIFNGTMVFKSASVSKASGASLHAPLSLLTHFITFVSVSALLAMIF